MTKCPICMSNLMIHEKEHIALTEQCAKNGKAWAQAQMGVYYLEGSSCEHGDAVPYKVDKNEALRWFKLAAEQRDPDAIRNIAQMYYGLYGYIVGVEKCHVKARAMMKEAADLGNLPAQRNYAMMCRLGEGGAEDKTQAAYYYTLAYCQKDTFSLSYFSDYNLPDKNIEEAAYYLGVYYYYGYGEFEKNLSVAKSYLVEAARDGDPRTPERQGYAANLYMYIAACLMEQYELQYGRNDHNMPGYSPVPRALALYRKSAQLGLEHSKEVLSSMESQLKMMCANACGKMAKKGEGLKACNRCRSVWYCSRECQTQHWKQGHKSDCVKFGSSGILKKEDEKKKGEKSKASRN